MPEYEADQEAQGGLEVIVDSIDPPSHPCDPEPGDPMKTSTQRKITLEFKSGKYVVTVTSSPVYGISVWAIETPDGEPVTDFERRELKARGPESDVTASGIRMELSRRLEQLLYEERRAIREAKAISRERRERSVAREASQ